MRKKIISAFVLIPVLIAAVAFSASAWLEEEWIYFDNCYYYLDEWDNTASFEGLDGYYDDYLEIPEYVIGYDYDDYDDEYREVKFAVTKINGFSERYDEYANNVKTVKIPDTVTEIAEKSVGWYTSYEYHEYYNEYYDEYYEEYYDEIKKVEGFTIICTEGSAAQEYADENGFKCVLLKSVAFADVTLSGETFIYNGNEIKPSVNVYYKGRFLREGVDYSVEYSGNVKAGTATVTVKGTGDYCGRNIKTFRIIPADASSAVISKIPAQYYTGKSIKPSFTVTLDSKKLKNGTDFTVTHTENKNIGKGKVTVKFKGNYSGTVTASYDIKMSPMSNVKYAATCYKIKLSWDKIKCDEYRIYRYNEKTDKYDLIKKTTSSSYTDSGLSVASAYTYKIRAAVKSGGTEYLNKTITVKAATKPKTPSPVIGRDEVNVRITWKKDKSVDGYQIGQYDYDYIPWWENDGENIKKIKTINDNSTVKWTKKIGRDNEYVYAVRAYKKLNGMTVYSDWSVPLATGSVEARVNMVELKSHRDIPVYNTQGETTVLAWTYTMSDNDIKLLKDFAKKNFTSKMSRLDKISYTLEWINREVTYDYSYVYGGYSYVEAIFKYKQGQCLQYNGALAAMLAYLGYDSRIIQGYRGSWPTNYWQHFWCEVKIAGVTYLCETGNYGKNGGWSYLMAEYPETRGYIKNHKSV